MAFDYFADEENKDKGGEQGGPEKVLGQESLVVNNSPTTAGGDADKKSSGAFTNLGSYLDANKDQQFGQQVAGKVQNTVNDANQQLDTTDTTFRGDVDKSTVKKDDSLLDDIKNDPTKVASDDARLGSFAQMRDATYAGPQHLSDENDLYSSTQGKTQKAADTANQTSTEGGRKAYLQQEYGSGVGRYDYTAGQQRLDNLLIQNDPGSRDAFANVQNAAKGTQQRFTDLSSALDAYAQQGKSGTEAARAAARGTVGLDEQGNITDDSPIMQAEKAAEARAAQFNTQKQQEASALQQALKSLNLSKDQLDKLQLSTGQTWGVDPSKYLTTGADATVGNSATADEQARVAALAKLAGKDNTFLPDADQAGKYDPTKANTYDAAAYNNAVNSAKAAIQPQVAARDKAQGIYDQALKIATPPVGSDEQFLLNANGGWNVDGIGLIQPILNAEGIDWRAAKSQYGTAMNFLNAMQSKYKSQAQQAGSFIPSNYQSAVNLKG